MSKNYDNWERLVAAVLRKQHDRELALCDSVDSSSISSASFSSNLSFDLTSRSDSMGFFLDERTRKNCFLLGATRFLSGPHWAMETHPKSRFEEVAKLDIRGRIKTKMLSPETLYAAYLVFGFTDEFTELASANSFESLLDDESYDDSKEPARIPQINGRTRGDEWIEGKMGEFYVGEDENRQVEVRLTRTRQCRSYGLIIEGIEFWPPVKTAKILGPGLGIALIAKTNCYEDALCIDVFSSPYQLFPGKRNRWRMVSS